MKPIIVAVAAWAAPLAALTAQTAPPFAATADSLVPGLLAEYLTPGAAVAVIRNGEVAWMKGYGFADEAAGRRVTPRTAFNIGSISKTVAAWGVMRLVEQGKLGLDEPVERYLTRWHLPPSSFDAGGVTIRRLLSHTAGLSLHGYPGFLPSERLPSVEASLSGATNGSGDVRIVMEPGTRWQYSGGGYTLLQLAIEEVTGLSFAEFMADSVLGPLGMRSSYYGWPPMIARAAATPYDDAGRPVPGPRFTALAAAGLQTTLEDFARFAQANLTGTATAAPRVLRSETIASMQSPQPASPDYGLGYGRYQLSPTLTGWGHSGANLGWMAVFEVIPATGDGIVVLTNGSNGGIVNRVLTCAWQRWLTAEEAPCLRPVGPTLFRTILADGVDAGIRRYHELKRAAADRYGFDEPQLNALGYALLRAGRVEDAIVIFKLNVNLFPQGFNTYDSLGEAYMVHGDSALAIANYEKSLQLNPDNTNAVEMLRRLER